MTGKRGGSAGITPGGIDLLLTYRCTGACAICTYHCSPGATECMDAGMALAALEAVAGHPLQWVLLFGGEPFLEYSLLLEVARGARRITAAPLTVFTNAYWAVSPARAGERLQPLADAALQRLYLSLDAYHAAHVPPERVSTAV